MTPAIPAQRVLDQIGTNVFLATPDLRLAYANQRAMQTLGAIEAEIHAAFGIGVSDLLGGSIHRFHRDPARIERILNDLSDTPHQATFNFGAVWLETTIRRCTDDAGRTLGYVVNWENVTARATAGSAMTKAGIELTSTSEAMRSVAETVSSQSQHAAAAAEEVSTTVQTVAAAAEELTASIREIASNAAEAAVVAARSADVAAGTGRTVRDLQTACQDVGNIVGLIAEIAGQTNLLALNASIEAARAGEAGRGFAVVASEVKDLAHNTARATENVAQKIESIQAATASVTADITRLGEIVEHIKALQTSIAGAVEEQSTVANEIGKSVTEVASASASIAQNVTAMADEAHRSLDSADATRRAANGLAGHAKALLGQGAVA